MINPVRTSARVTLTIEVDIPPQWGDDCELKQVYQQAADEVEGMVRKFADAVPGARLIGKPRVLAILAERSE